MMSNAAQLFTASLGGGPLPPLTWNPSPETGLWWLGVAGVAVAVALLVAVVAAVRREAGGELRPDRKPGRPVALALAA